MAVSTPAFSAVASSSNGFSQRSVGTSESGNAPAYTRPSATLENSASTATSAASSTHWVRAETSIPT